MPESFFNKVAVLKKRLWHRCFPVNFAEFSRAHESAKNTENAKKKTKNRSGVCK